MGTSTAADAKRYFQAMDTHRKSFKTSQPEDRQLVDLAFSKKRADERKDWLKTCTPDTFLDHGASSEISIADFINKELILFSQADNVRSIPSMMDGLKPGQRKILFACFKRKLKGEIKVMQLAGYVSEHAAYHHGEQSLCQTIVGLAQNFVGSNNLNLLEPNGQFGTRLQGGKDAASPRYIFTALSPFARTVFKADDDALLRYLTDDGQSIEPEWYAPILPMVLVNGCEGIGTGWSTSVPSYNPGEIARNLLRLMDSQPPEPLHPWYSGFRGTIEPLDESCTKYRVAGIWRKIDDTTLQIDELPVGSWTQAYKEWLETLVTADSNANFGLRDYKEHHTDATVSFILHLTEAGMKAAESEGIEKRFKLSTTLSLSNLVCFDPAGRIKKYTEGPNQILADFYDIRLQLYQRRKDHLADVLTREWTVLDSKVRFIREIVEGRLVVHKRKKAEIVADLRAREYHCMTDEKKETAGDAEEATDDASNSVGSGYEYLLRMPIYALTHERMEQLQSERDAKSAALDALLARTPKDLWRSDLEEFLAMWEEKETSKTSQLASLAASAGGSGKGKAKAAPKKKAAAAASAVVAAKRAVYDDDEEDESDVEYGETESDDDIEVYETKKPASQPKKPASEKTVPAEKKAPAAKKLVPVGEKKPAAKRTKAAAPVASAAAASPATGRTGPLDLFVTRKPPVVPLVESEDEMDLPLNERIARMLNRKAASSSATPSVVSAPPVAKPATMVRPATKATAIVSDEEEESESAELSDDDLPPAMEAIAKPRKPAAKPKAAAPSKPKKKNPVISDDEDDDDYAVDDEDDTDVFEID